MKQGACAVAARRGVAPATLVGAVLAWCVAPALAAPSVTVTSPRFGNVFVTGEPAMLAATVAAEAGVDFQGEVAVSVVDAYGRYVGFTSAAVDLSPGTSVTHDIAITSPLLGQFTIVTKLSDARARTVALVETTAGIVPPVDESDAAESAIGYFVLPDDSELPRANEIASQMRRFGIRWVRMAYNWWLDGRPIRPDVGDPAWLNTSSFEAWTDAFRANGIEVLGVLFGTARWASRIPDADDPVAGIPRWGLVPSLDPADWGLFVRTIAERVRGRVMTWEVWNEPDISAFWQAGPAEYARLLRATAVALHDVDASVRVLVNLVNRSDSGVAFTDTVLASAGDVIDVFGFHYGTDDARDFLRLLRPGVAIWDTESHGAPRQISRWLAERAAGVDRIFSFIYHTVLDDADVPDFARFGRYPVNGDYTPRPDAIALTTLSRLLGNLPLVAADVAGLGYVAYFFSRPAGEILALADGNEPGVTWSPRKAVQLRLRLPRGVRRVTVIDLMGNSAVLRVRKRRLRLRLEGVAAFLLPEPGTSLRGLRVVRAGRARRR